MTLDISSFTFDVPEWSEGRQPLSFPQSQFYAELYQLSDDDLTNVGLMSRLLDKCSEIPTTTEMLNVALIKKIPQEGIYRMYERGARPNYLSIALAHRRGYAVFAECWQWELPLMGPLYALLCDTKAGEEDLEEICRCLQQMPSSEYNTELLNLVVLVTGNADLFNILCRHGVHSDALTAMLAESATPKTHLLEEKSIV